MKRRLCNSLGCPIYVISSVDNTKLPCYTLATTYPLYSFVPVWHLFIFSERADSTGATGDRLKEGSAINKSLSTLGNCIKGTCLHHLQSCISFLDTCIVHDFSLIFSILHLAISRSFYRPHVRFFFNLFTVISFVSVSKTYCTLIFSAGGSSIWEKRRAR